MTGGLLIWTAREQAKGADVKSTGDPLDDFQGRISPPALKFSNIAICEANIMGERL